MATTAPVTTRTPESHLEYFKLWYDYLNDTPLIQRVWAGYDAAKHSCTLAESTLAVVEDGVNTGISTIAKPAYTRFGYPTTDRLVDIYGKSVDNSKVALDNALSAAAHTGALSLGVAVVMAQMGLLATTSATSAFLSSLIYTKKAGAGALASVQSAEKVVEQRFYDSIAYTQELAKVPTEKISEHANNFLDIANAVFERLLALPEEKEPVDSSVVDRIRFLSHRVTSSLYQSAQTGVIDPAKAGVHAIATSLGQKLDFADSIRARKQWATSEVEKRFADLRATIEDHALQYRISPEEMLLKSIRHSSEKLSDNFKSLRERGQELNLGNVTLDRINQVTEYIENLDDTLANASDIYQVNDEIFTEGKNRISEVLQWTAGLVNGSKAADVSAANSNAQSPAATENTSDNGFASAEHSSSEA